MSNYPNVSACKMGPDLIAFIIYLSLAAVAGLAVVASPALSGALRARTPRGRVGSLGFGGKFRVPFFLMAVLFLIFEMGVLILFPWAIAFGWMVRSGVGLVVLLHLIAFALVVGVALAFAFGSRALDWEG